MYPYEDANATVADRINALTPEIRKYAAQYGIPAAIITAFIVEESGGLMWVMNGGGDGRDPDWQSHGDGGCGLFQLTPPYHPHDHDRMMTDLDYQFDLGVAFITECLQGSGGDIRGAAGQYGPHNANGTPYAPYGDKIVNLVIQYAWMDNAGPQPPTPVEHTDLHFIDLRDQLATAPGNGPGRIQVPKVGIVQHYNGPPVHQAVLDQMKSDAQYHIAEDWGGGAHGDGIMYHLAVGDEQPDGSLPPIYILRNLDAVLWHCASWEAGGNGSGFSIQCAIGQSDDGVTEVQHAGPGQIHALAHLYDLLRTPGAIIQTDRGEVITVPNGGGFGADMVKGHQEMSSSQCPGTLMDDLIRPYRAGTIESETLPPVAPLVPVDPYAFTDSVTRYFVGGAFARVWTLKGGLPVFGHPLTREYDHVDADGVTRTTQIFEREQFSFYPEYQGTDNEVQFARLGAMEAKAEGFTGPGL